MKATNDSEHRIVLVPENAEDRVVMQNILDQQNDDRHGGVLLHWGDATVNGKETAAFTAVGEALTQWITDDAADDSEDEPDEDDVEAQAIVEAIESAVSEIESIAFPSMYG